MILPSVNFRVFSYFPSFDAKVSYSDVGKVTQVKETAAKICSLKIGEVEGKILNYSGGDEGREDAEWLTDIIRIGEY